MASTLMWLSSMLDNAIEATYANPIYIQISVTSVYFNLHMANEYTGSSKGQDIRIILEEGYSTKDLGRGIGLLILSLTLFY